LVKKLFSPSIAAGFLLAKRLMTLGRMRAYPWHDKLIQQFIY
jgi:hypothetical protein